MKMEYPSFFDSPKRDEQQVPDSAVNEIQFLDVKAKEESKVMNDLFEGICWEIEDDEKLQRERSSQSQLTWDFMDWDRQEQQEREEGEVKGKINVKTEEEENSVGFWESENENRVSLNLNLNYQEVLDAWSDRGPLWAGDYSLSSASCSGYYMGEVPVIEEERSTRREASVLRYKEKRQSRMFSKKIRYQVRKLNADNRPRIKGRFVKRVS